MLQFDELLRSRDARSRTIARLSGHIAAALGLQQDGPIESQIVRLAGAYVRLTAPRNGHPALTSDEALWAVWHGAGEHYQPELVDALIEVVGRRRSRKLACTHA